MAFDELKKDIIEADADVRSYLEQSDEYLKLQVFKVLMRFLTTSSHAVFVGMAIILVLFFLSLGASLALCEYFDSYYLGFLIVGAFYALVSVVLFVIRKRWNGPLLRKFSLLYFD